MVEAKSTKRWIVGVAIAALLGGMWTRREFFINRCIDADGRWNSGIARPVPAISNSTREVPSNVSSLMPTIARNGHEIFSFFPTGPYR